MKLKVLSLIIGLGLTSIATTVRADIILMNPLAGKSSVCEQVTGHWTGTGKAVTAGGLLTCYYDGKADITSDKVDEFSLKNLELNLKKKDSSSLCPSHEVLELSGECHNGKIIIHTAAAKLDGEFINDGNTANMNGTVTFTVPFIGKVTPDVVMTLNKK